MMTERKVHFIASLNQVYCVKSHFSERIIDLIDNPSFSLVGQELTNLVAQTDLELYHLDRIFYCLNERLSFSNLKALIESLDTLYDNVTDVIDVPQLGHIGLFDYLSQLKKQEESALISLHRVGRSMENTTLDNLLSRINETPGWGLLTTFQSCYPASFTKEIPEFS